ncbi:unnamed protein product [Agarophyton chilense]
MKTNDVFYRVIHTAVISISLKLLLLPTNYSTDLHVHRNWKAITYNLPLSQWYTDNTSQWTLDYPPLFAFFEYILAQALHLVDASVTNLTEEDKVSDLSVILLKASVLVGEIALIFAVSHLLSTLVSCEKLSKSQISSAASLLLFVPGLTLVDNIHFQYNALPISLLLLTLSYLFRGRPHLACVAFCVGLNLKQTLLPLVPTISVYFLATLPRRLSSAIRTLFSLFFVTMVTLFVPWVPLYFVGGASYTKAAISRLFPFGRGLLHANWAPNFWALYAVADRILLQILPVPNAPTTTSGKIGENAPFVHLPNPTPFICTALVVISITLVLRRLYENPSVDNLILSTSVNLHSSFLFGWHVHEKAALLTLYPLILGSLVSKEMHGLFLLFSLASQFAMFELVRRPAEEIFVVLHFVAYHMLVVSQLSLSGLKGLMLTAYAIGLLTIEAYAGVFGVHHMIFSDRLQFLPILLVSVYSAAGIVVSFLDLLHRTLHWSLA